MVYIFLDSDIKLIEKYIIHIQIYYDYEYADFKICEFAMVRLGLNVWANIKNPKSPISVLKVLIKQRMYIIFSAMYEQPVYLF